VQERDGAGQIDRPKGCALSDDDSAFSGSVFSVSYISLIVRSLPRRFGGIHLHRHCTIYLLYQPNVFFSNSMTSSVTLESRD
jgi:hypothetical protein